MIEHPSLYVVYLHIKIGFMPYFSDTLLLYNIIILHTNLETGGMGSSHSDKSAGKKSTGLL